MRGLNLTVCISFSDFKASQPGQIEDLALFKDRKSSIRRSARSGTIKGPVDPKSKNQNTST